MEAQDTFSSMKYLDALKNRCYRALRTLSVEGVANFDTRRNSSAISEAISSTSDATTEPKESTQGYASSKSSDDVSSSFSAMDPRYFLLGGINPSPNVPTHRRTSIPLTMHEDDYHRMLQVRCKQWRLDMSSSASSEYLRQFGSQETTNSFTNKEHVCPYLNGAEICRTCMINKKRQAFLDKLGKLCITTEYQSEDDRILVLVSQYGNIRVDGHNELKKPNIQISIQLITPEGRKVKKFIRLDWSRTKSDFKFNYLTYFDCKSLDEAMSRVLSVKIFYKKAFYAPKKTLKQRTILLNTIESDPEQPEEKLL